MYQEYYQLQRDPFRLAPDPRFSYPHRSFAAAYRHLQEALAQEECFVMVVARPGTGKTTLTETFVEQLDAARYQVAQLNTTQVDPTELLRLIAFGYELEADELDRAAILHRLQEHWRHLLATGRRALLIVDEAQGLGVDALEQLRLLSNLHERDRALVQIFLVGQEQLHGLLDDPQLEQLQQRIVGVCRLEALSLEEVRDYVHHRLCLAGWRGDPAIEPAALVLMHRFSQGLPRYINRLANRLLLHGALEQKHRLDATDMAAVLLDLSEELLTPVHERPGPEGSSDRDLLCAIAASQPWHDMLSGTETQFLQRTDFDPPPLLTETGAETRTPPARSGTWLRWGAAAAVLLAVALPAAFLYEPLNALAASMLPNHQPAVRTATLAPQPLPPAVADTRPPAVEPELPAPAATTTPAVTPQAGFAPVFATTPAIQPLELANLTAAPPSTGVSTERATEAAPPASAPDKVETLLAKAEQAISDDRLTVPRDDNAYDYLLQARALEPEHPQVQAGLEQIAQRYGVLARWWMEQGDYGKAVRLLERGFEVRPGHPSLHALRRDMHALALQGGQPSPFPSAFDEGGSEPVSPAQPSRETDTAGSNAPALLQRLKALLSGGAGPETP